MDVARKKEDVLHPPDARTMRLCGWTPRLYFLRRGPEDLPTYLTAKPTRTPTIPTTANTRNKTVRSVVHAKIQDPRPHDALLLPALVRRASRANAPDTHSLTLHGLFRRRRVESVLPSRRTALWPRLAQPLRCVERAQRRCCRVCLLRYEQT